MKKKSSPVWFGLVLMFLVQLTCTMGNLPAQYECEMEGGIWHTPILEEPGWCEKKSQPENEDAAPAETMPNEPQVNLPIEETEAYASPTPASAQECNATLYMQAQVEVVENTQETYYRDCVYKLSVGNIHPGEAVWVVRHTNVSVYGNSTNSDSAYWYSDLLMPGQVWEYQFRSSYFTDGQSSREGVDKVAGVFNRLECVYLLHSPEVEAISQSVDWACAP